MPDQLFRMTEAALELCSSHFGQAAADRDGITLEPW
jgi:hypothetical protein